MSLIWKVLLQSSSSSMTQRQRRNDDDRSQSHSTVNSQTQVRTKKPKKSPNSPTQTKRLIKAAIFPKNCKERERSQMSLSVTSIFASSQTLLSVTEILSFWTGSSCGPASGCCRLVQKTYMVWTGFLCWYFIRWSMLNLVFSSTLSSQWLLTEGSQLLGGSGVQLPALSQRLLLECSAGFLRKIGVPAAIWAWGRNERRQRRTGKKEEWGECSESLSKQSSGIQAGCTCLVSILCLKSLGYPRPWL